MVCDYKASFDQAYSFNDESQGTTNVTVNFKNVKITIDVASLSSSEVKLYLISRLLTSHFVSFFLYSCYNLLTHGRSYNLQSTDMTVDSKIKIDKDCCGKEVEKRNEWREVKHMLILFIFFLQLFYVALQSNNEASTQLSGMCLTSTLHPFLPPRSLPSLSHLTLHSLLTFLSFFFSSR